MRLVSESLVHTWSAPGQTPLLHPRTFNRAGLGQWPLGPEDSLYFTDHYWT